MTPRQAVGESFDAQAQGPVAERALAACVRRARNLDRRAARARRGAAAVRNADGAGRQRRGVSARARRANLAVSIRRRRLRGCGAAPDRLAHLGGRRRRARARRPAFSELRHELRRGGLRAAARRRCGRRSIADASRRARHRRRDSRASTGRANLWRGARRRPTRQRRAANQRESVHDGGGQYRPRRDDRHHDRVPPDGALRRRRVQPARAADADAALRPAGHARGRQHVDLGRAARRGGDRFRNGGRRPPSGTTKRRAQHPVARSVRPRGARARHATRVARQPQPRAESRPRARRGMDCDPQRRIDTRTAAPPRACSCSRRRPSCTCSIRWRRACRWTATSSSRGARKSAARRPLRL